MPSRTVARPALTVVMTLSASEFHEAGLALPPSVGKDVALRLLESIEVDDRESADKAWTVEIGSREGDILSGKVEMIPHEVVKAELAERRAARHAERQ